MDLANSAIRLFREQYRAASGTAANHVAHCRPRGNSALPLAQLLRERGILTEQRITHPSLPLLVCLTLFNKDRMVASLL